MTKKQKMSSVAILGILIFSIVMFSIIFRNEIIIIFKNLGSGSEWLKDYVKGLGIVGVILIVFFQMMLVVITILPSEITLITAGISYGTLVGALLCWIGVIIGNQITYQSIKHTRVLFETPKKKKQREELELKIQKSDRNIYGLIFLLYLTPGIPFGLVANIASSSGLKWWKYTLATMFGPLITIFFTVVVGSQLTTSSPNLSAFIFIFIVILVLVVLFNKTRIIHFVFNRRNIRNELINFKVRKPNGLLYAILVKYFEKATIKKYNVDIKYEVDLKEIDGPFIAICNHASRIDYIYLAYAMYPHKLNFVVDYYQFRVKYLNVLLKIMGAIPKLLYQPDGAAVKNMMKVIKDKGNLALFPEGILSASGQQQPVHPATGKFLKKVKVPVIAVSTSGAYLTRPKFSTKNHKGKVDVRVYKLIDEKDYENLSVEQIEEKLKTALTFNDFEYNREKKYKYEGLDKAENLDGILYYCPHCHKEYTLESKGNSIWCKDCGLKVDINDDYSFTLNKEIPVKDINEWYELQRKIIRSEINDDYVIESDVRYVELDNHHYTTTSKVEMGAGHLKLSKEGMTYIGTRKGQPFEVHVPIYYMPSMSYKAKEYFEFYYEGWYYSFYPSNPYSSAKFVLSLEELHKVYGGV